MSISKAEGKNKDGLQKYKVRVKYRTSDGQRKEKTKITYGHTEAKTVETLLLKEVKSASKLSSERPTVQVLYEEYTLSKQSEVRESSLDKTKRILNRYVLEYFKNTKLDKLGVKELEQWKRNICALNLALTTRQNIYGEFRAMLNYGVKMEYILINPLIKVGNFRETISVKKEMQFYTPEEFKKFIAVAEECAKAYENKYNSYYEWNYYVFFNIAFYTGCRKGEIHGLKWSDLKGSYISIKRSVNQKLHKDRDVETAPKNSSSIRTIEIPLQLIKVLKDHKNRQIQTNTFGEDKKILGCDNCSLRDSTICKRNERYAKMAGVKRIRIHDFRHSHASLLAHKNISIHLIAKRLGHSDIKETLNCYSHAYPKEEERAISVLNSLGI